MSRLIALRFEDPEVAEQALAPVQSATETDQFSFEDALTILDACLAEQEGMEQEVTDTLSVSTGHLAAVYSLRQHIRLAVELLRKRKAYLGAGEAKRDTEIDNSA